MGNKMQTRCCIAGGGPAGMMLGYLLARAGVETVVLEKHADFLRDFRGDTVHPSTLENIYELGLLEEFLKRPHNELREGRACIGPFEVSVADFTHLSTHCQFLAFMPQWDFLDFLSTEAKRYPTFQLIMQAEVTELIKEEGMVKGLRAKTPQGDLEVRSSLVVGADGRHSVVRQAAGLVIEDLGAPIDVLWMRLSKKPDDVKQALGNFNAGAIFIMLNRDTYWQCGLVIPKGGFQEFRHGPIELLHQAILKVAPHVADRISELKSWDEVRLLTVQVDRLKRWWKPGLLCIGDSAHAMSPIGGVGINLAIQDAVAAANLLWSPLKMDRLKNTDLARVEQRRRWPVTVTQGAQLFAQNRIISRLLKRNQPITKLPLLLKLLQNWPFLRRLPAYAIGIGARPEHIHSPNTFSSSIETSG